VEEKRPEAKKSKESKEEKRIRKLSRKDVAGMSTSEFTAEMRVPFLRLLSYVGPYKTRFIMGIVFGAISGLFGAVMMFGMKFTFETLLPSGQKAEIIIDPGNAVPAGVGLIEPNPRDPAKPYWKDVEFKRIEEGQYEGWHGVDISKESGDIVKKIPFTDKTITIPKPDFSTSTGVTTAILISLLIPLMMGIRGLLTYFANYSLLFVGNRVQHDLRSQLFEKLTRHSLRFYSKQKTGELIQTVFNQTRMAAAAGTELSTSMVKDPISILAMVVVLFVWDWKFAISALVVFPLCMLPVILISRSVRKAGGKEEEQAGMVMVAMQESFAGIRTVKSYAREDYEQNRFNHASLMMMGFIMRWRKAMEIVSPMVETVASVGIAVALVYAKWSGMTSGQFLMMFMALIAIYPHAKALSRVQIQLQKCLIASTKVFEIMDTPWEVDDAEDAVDIPNPNGGIRMKGLTFGYQSDQPAVRELDVDFEPGKTYALVGPSGAGKTTIFSLLMRFYDPDEGTIEYDGIDVRKLKQDSLRDNIGIVNQDTFLFHDTIGNNIRYGRLDATEEEIEEAARKANAHDFIMAQPNGYETKVGDQGSTLSGGQQQRISIARTILRSAPVLLLDEAYSALDTESEKKIQDAIEDFSEGKTVIAIAHRLSTVLGADQIIVMNQGWVEARGTHEELLQHCELYQRLYRLQFEGEALIAEAADEAAAEHEKDSEEGSEEDSSAEEAEDSMTT